MGRVPGKQILRWSLAFRAFIRECSWDQPMWQGSETSRILQKKSSWDAVSVEAAAIPKGGSDGGVALQNCPQLSWECWSFIVCVNQSLCGLFWDWEEVCDLRCMSLSKVRQSLEGSDSWELLANTIPSNWGTKTFISDQESGWWTTVSYVFWKECLGRNNFPEILFCSSITEYFLLNPMSSTCTVTG